MAALDNRRDFDVGLPLRLRINVILCHRTPRNLKKKSRRNGKLITNAKTHFEVIRVVAIQMSKSPVSFAVILGITQMYKNDISNPFAL